MSKGEILDAVKRVDNLLANAKIVQPVLSRMDQISIAQDMKNIYDYIALDENADEPAGIHAIGPNGQDILLTEE
jgi:hypothetical protein